MPETATESSGEQRARLGAMSLIVRLGCVSLIVAAVAALFLYAGGWFTPHALTPARIIDTFEQVSGPHPGFRRNHA